MNDDSISRQAAIKAFYIQSDDDGWWVGTAQDAETLLNGLPTIDPVKHGKWVMQGTAYGCSLCGEGAIHPFHNYCPNCGARMSEDGKTQA